MSSYDHSTTVFSDEGRLLQVEYAIKSVSTAPPILAIPYESQILIVSQKKIPSLFDEPRTEKILKISESAYIAVSGVLADANYLIEDARLFSLDYLKERGEALPLQELSIHIANLMQHATQNGGLRPFGVGGLLLSENELYQIDPSGNVAKWQAAAVGSASGDINQKIKEQIEKIQSFDDLMKAGVRALAKGVEKEDLNTQGVEIAVLRFVEHRGRLEYVESEKVKEICDFVKHELESEEDAEARK